MRRTKIVVMVLSLFLLLTGCSNNPKDIITKTENFETTETSYNKEFEKEIEENGKTYQLKDVKYELLDQEVVLEKKVLEEEVEFTNLEEKKANYKDSIEVNYNNKKYILNFVDITYYEQEIGKRTKKVTSSIKYGYDINKPDYPLTKKIKYFDEVSGKSLDVELPFKKLELIENYKWLNDVKIDLTFKNYGSKFYMLNGKAILYNEYKPALEGYEKDILELVNLDSSKYRINDINWNGASYVEDNITYRKAIATGDRYVAKYKAVYEAEINLPEATLYKAIAKYQTDIEVETDAIKYNVNAIATYEEKQSIMPIILFSLGGIILLIFIIIFIVKKVNKKSDIPVEGWENK